MALTKQTSQEIVNTGECTVCGVELSFNTALEIGELVECYDCGTELEVETVTPNLVLIEAPTEGEDWGE